MQDIHLIKNKKKEVEQEFLKLKLGEIQSNLDSNQHDNNPNKKEPQIPPIAIITIKTL